MSFKGIYKCFRIIADMDRLTVMIFLLGLGFFGQVTTQKLTRSIEYSSRFGQIKPNEIDPDQVYTHDEIDKQQFNGHYKDERNFVELEEEELLRAVTDKNVPIDVEKWNYVGDQVITRANVSEETKRVVRQVKKQRPGFFWTLFRVAFEVKKNFIIIICCCCCCCAIYLC